MTEIPVIETERLRLRAHSPNDFAACCAMWADPVVTKYIGGKPSTTQQTWARILTYGGHWVHLGYGYWAVEEKATGTFVGELGFADFKRDIAPSMQNVPELGWALATPAHGKGYATEAVRAATAWGDRNLASARTVCLINPENVASIRVAQKCGFHEFASGELGGVSTLFFERYR